MYLYNKIFTVLFALLIIECSYAQFKVRLDVITENSEFQTIQNKVPNRVNYYSKSKNNLRNCSCDLRTYDSAILKKISDYEYTITPIFKGDLSMNMSILIYEICKAKKIDSFSIDVKREPLVRFEESTYKNEISPSLYKSSNDGILDTLFFYVYYGLDWSPRVSRKLDLNVVRATINLVDKNRQIIDSFEIKSNYLTSQEKEKMRKYYERKEYNYQTILINNILLIGKDGVLFKPTDPFTLPAKAIISME